MTDISIEVLRLIGTKSPSEARQELLDEGELPTIELRTFALLLTPIEDSMGDTVGYVAQWANGTLTVCSADTDKVSLLETWDSPPDQFHTREEALAWWYEAQETEETQ
jgi:hypothetical protein